MRRWAPASNLGAQWRARSAAEHRVPEGLSAAEVGKEIAEHHEHADHHEHAEHEHASRDRVISIVEAVLLSIVALLAAWSGYSAAKWGTESSISLAKASSTRTKASLAEIQANQIRTLDSVSFNAAETAYAAHNVRLFNLALRRLRPGYRPAVDAWLALHPLKNPNAPPDPSYMPQYRIPQQAQATALNAQADAYFTEGQSDAGTADKYVRLTVFLAAVLFLVGIGSRFPLRMARYGLIGVAVVLLVVSVVQLLGLPGPPS
jgi:heme/copper-type cytochrome/quinol oxidase subunit 4